MKKLKTLIISASLIIACESSIGYSTTYHWYCSGEGGSSFPCNTNIGGDVGQAYFVNSTDLTSGRENNYYIACSSNSTNMPYSVSLSTGSTALQVYNVQPGSGKFQFSVLNNSNKHSNSFSIVSVDCTQPAENGRPKVTTAGFGLVEGF